MSLRGRNANIRYDDDGWWNEDSRWPTRNSSADEDEEFDPITIVAAECTLSEHLRIQIAPLLEDGEDEIADFIIDSLNEKGFLTISLDEVAESCHCSPQAVETVLRRLQTLDPCGVGARSIQECLLIPVGWIENGNGEVSLARSIVSQHWDDLTKLSLDTIARQLHALARTTSASLAGLHRPQPQPFPANSDWRGPGQRGATGSLHPGYYRAAQAFTILVTKSRYRKAASTVCTSIVSTSN